MTHTATPSTLAQLPTIAGLKIFVFVVGICLLGSAVVYGFYLLLQLGSGRLMLGIRLIRAATAPLREISYTGGLPVVTCCWFVVLGLYAYVLGEPVSQLKLQYASSHDLHAHLLTHPITHLLTHSPAQSLTHPPNRMLTRSLSHSLVHSPTRSHTHPLMHRLPHALMPRMAE